MLDCVGERKDDERSAMRLERRTSRKKIACACLLLIITTLGLGAQERYANPVVFQRAHLEETTGEEVLRAKLWVIEGGWVWAASANLRRDIRRPSVLLRWPGACAVRRVSGQYAESEWHCAPMGGELLLSPQSVRCHIQVW